MKYLSLFSGICAATAAWKPIGWSPYAFAEIEPFPCAVLAHRHPEVPNLGNVMQVEVEPGTVGLVVGGSPCQSFSVAGKRLGLDDPRGNLALVYLRIVRRARPRWMVYENVPGLLSSAGGDDFAAFLSAASGWHIDAPAAGWGNSGVIPQRTPDDYGLAYRVLDAQFFGVPQRRRRVFVVGHLGDWRRAAAVLFERHSLSGNPPPGREAESGIAPSVTPGARRASGNRGGEQLAIAGSQTARYGKGTDSDACDPMVVTVASSTGAGYWQEGDQAGTIRAREQESHEHLIAHTLRGDGFDASEDGTGRGTPLIPTTAPTLFASNGGVSSGYNNVGPMGTLRKGDGGTTSGIPFVAFNPQAGGKQTSLGYDPESSTVGTLGCCQTPAIAYSGEHHASPAQADPGTLLRALRDEVAAEAFTQWRSRVFDSLQRLEVLRSGLHGEGVRREAGEARPKLDDRPLPRPEDLPAGILREMWQAAWGSSSQRRELAQQLSREPGTTLPQLPHETSSTVRRLTPRETERLQGFPDDWTLVPHRGKPAADGPRYKAIGNSFAVPVIRWIGQRIQMVDDMEKKGVLRDA